MQLLQCDTLWCHRPLLTICHGDPRLDYIPKAVALFALEVLMLHDYHDAKGITHNLAN